ncbi:MAG: histidinol-phosphate aminotransferase family protein [Deltaproteobacteria bacterium]|nr:histidinol-phosphate aminotransferase family protein [Deltaproteobacteria bacterium]
MSGFRATGAKVAKDAKGRGKGSGPRPRPEVLTVRAYAPPLEGRRGLLRLDFNENTVGCSPAVLRALRRLGGEAVATYPEYGRLREVLARRLGVGEDEVLPTGGIDEALHVLAQAFVERGDGVVTPAPGFVMYRVYSELAGAELRTVRWGPGAAFPEAGLRRAMRGARLLFVATPNNPTGSVAPRAALGRLARAHPRCLVAIDEAYFEFHGVTALPLLRRHGNVVVLRTFSKAYGLAALRLGCVVARPPVIDALARVRSPYSVNGLAAILAEAALADRGFLRRTVGEARRAVAFLRRELGRRGIRSWPSAANFVLARFGRAGELAEFLRAKGILVRDQSGHPGLEGCVRVGAGTVEQTRRFLGELDAWLACAGFDQRRRRHVQGISRKERKGPPRTPRGWAGAGEVKR